MMTFVPSFALSLFMLNESCYHFVATNTRILCNIDIVAQQMIRHIGCDSLDNDETCYTDSTPILDLMGRLTALEHPNDSHYR